MYFIPENYTFTEAVFTLLTKPHIMTAGTFTLVATTLLTAYHMYTKPDTSSLFKILSVSLTFGLISSILASLIFALVIAYLLTSI